MKTTLIILNLIAALLVYPAMKLVDAMHTIRIGMFYVEIDRAQLLNQEKLEDILGENHIYHRQLIPEKFIRKDNTDSWALGYPCVFGFLMNALLLAFMKRHDEKNKRHN